MSVVSADTVLVSLEATATFNNPADDLSDPTYPRRIALAIGEDRALVVADTQLSKVYEPFQTFHWYFEGEELVMVEGRRVERWRLDRGSWKLSPVR